MADDAGGTLISIFAIQIVGWGALILATFLTFIIAFYCINKVYKRDELSRKQIKTV